MSFQWQIYRKTIATIHLDHLSHNISELRKFFGTQVFFCPMVKANAYGHGDVEIARQLERESVKFMGVSLIEEGVLLRQMGIKAEILVFGIFDRAGAEEIIRWKMTPVLSLWEQVEIFEKLGTQNLDVHLKFDTGMHRLGFSYQEADKLYERLKSSKNMQVKGILTHLHTGEDISDEFGESYQQLNKFKDIEKVFSPLRPLVHSLNTAGALGLAKKGHLTQGVRPGLSIYGYSSTLEFPSELNLKPVMSLRSHAIRYHRIKKSEGVSYSHTWKANRDSVVAIVPIGYADGYHRTLSNQAEVLFDGVRVPVVGNVCMDFITIDVTDVVKDQSLNAYLNQEVTLFGYDSKGNLLPATDLAASAKTIPYEILTSISERVPRRFLEQSQFIAPNKTKEVGR